MDHPYFYRDQAGNDAVAAHLYSYPPVYSYPSSDDRRKECREWAANNGWTVEFLSEIPSWWNYPHAQVALYREIRGWLPKDCKSCCEYQDCHARATRRGVRWRFCEQHKDHLEDHMKELRR
jgi:hypothetical protein